MSSITKIIRTTAAAAVLAAGIGGCGVNAATVGKVAHEHPIKAAEKALHAEFAKLDRRAVRELALPRPQTVSVGGGRCREPI
jgi:hypothetical protein